MGKVLLIKHAMPIGQELEKALEVRRECLRIPDPIEQFGGVKDSANLGDFDFLGEAVRHFKGMHNFGRGKE